MSYPKLTQNEAEIACLLSTATEMYGLEMVKNSNVLKRGTIYVYLSRMAEKGYVESRLEDTAVGDGPPRRLYKLTGLGARAYRAMQSGQRAFEGLEGAWAI